MQYRVLGDTIPAVEVMFDMPGEGIYTQSGGMAWMTDGIDMATNTKGGLMKGPSSVEVLGMFRSFCSAPFSIVPLNTLKTPIFTRKIFALSGLFLLKKFLGYVIIIVLYSTLSGGRLWHTI